MSKCTIFINQGNMILEHINTSQNTKTPVYFFYGIYYEGTILVSFVLHHRACVVVQDKVSNAASGYDTVEVHWLTSDSLIAHISYSALGKIKPISSGFIYMHAWPMWASIFPVFKKRFIWQTVMVKRFNTYVPTHGVKALALLALFIWIKCWSFSLVWYMLRLILKHIYVAVNIQH